MWICIFFSSFALFSEQAEATYAIFEQAVVSMLHLYYFKDIRIGWTMPLMNCAILNTRGCIYRIGVSDDTDPLFCQREIRGICRVICYHPDTNRTMSTMSVAEIVDIVHMWIEQFNQLKHKYIWIQIFENRGSAVGCSNTHPHGQLWAGDFLPNLPKRKDKCQREFYEKTGRPLLVEYLEKEVLKKERIVLHNEYWTVLVPFWAFWPYETMILPNRHVKKMDELTQVISPFGFYRLISLTYYLQEEQVSLADILRKLITRYDNIFQMVCEVTCPIIYQKNLGNALCFSNKSCLNKYSRDIQLLLVINSMTVKIFLVYTYETSSVEQTHKFL
uniref:Galactose-1-phosphate uridylyltransferase n=1 Tax=Heterorhabditis bacteriophora TaxID=37862 RepID=A0A1I7W744_HETBA